MKLKTALILIALMLLLPVFSARQASAQPPVVEIEVTDYPTLVFDGDPVPVVVQATNVGNAIATDVFLLSSTGERRSIGTLIPYIEVQSTLFLENYKLGTNEVDIYASYSGGVSARRSVQFEVRSPEESITLRVIDAPASIYNGMIYTARLEVQNLRQESVSGTRITSGDDTLYYVGALNANESRFIELQVEDYQIGVNSLQLVAEHERGSAPPLTLKFEVRPSEESIALRVINAPTSIYEGMVYTARLEVQNLLQEAVTRARITSGEDTIYYIGALNANESQEIQLRLEEYETGVNSLQLVAEHERGKASPITLEFEGILAESAVKAYLASLNSPVYVAEIVELSIVVAASEDAEISELEVKALNEEVQPAGYYLGEGVAAEEEVNIEMVDVGSLLTGTQSANDEEEPERAVKGRELNFEAKDLGVGNQSLSFEITYRLGSTAVHQEFSVNVLILGASSVKLIQAQQVVAERGEKAMITLHVANGLPVDVDAVSVVPVGNTTTSPSEFFIGQMSPDDFLPAYFVVSGSELEERDELQFKVVYRVGRQIYETQPLRVEVNFEESKATLQMYWYLVVIVVVVLLVVLFWWLRRRGLRSFSSTKLVVLVLLAQLLWYLRRGPWIH